MWMLLFACQMKWSKISRGFGGNKALWLTNLLHSSLYLVLWLVFKAIYDSPSGLKKGEGSWQVETNIVHIFNCGSKLIESAAFLSIIGAGLYTQTPALPWVISMGNDLLMNRAWWSGKCARVVRSYLCSLHPYLFQPSNWLIAVAGSWMMHVSGISFPKMQVMWRGKQHLMWYFCGLQDYFLPPVSSNRCRVILL